MFKIIFLKDERNDATDYYVKLIKETIENQGCHVEIITDIRLVEKNDKVLTITLKAFFYTWLRNPEQFIIHWFQGVSPEEVMLLYPNSWTRWIRKAYLTFFERFTLRKSKFNFFVSKSMQEHYLKKYKYIYDNFMVMPCYNQKINAGGFNDAKYLNPTFVYAGSLSNWQCINETFFIFKSVQNKIPDAVMYLYTKEVNNAKLLISKFGLKNVVVDYVPYDELNKKLQDIKYGFLIRHDIPVNNVATPTKMNGYLANGVIPIFSDIIDDFEKKINSDFIVKSNDLDCLVDKILEFETKKIDSREVFSQYNHIFSNYYSDSSYMAHILNNFKKYEVL